MIRESAHEMSKALASGETTATELTKKHFERIDAVDSKVKAFLYLDKEGALESASIIDERRRKGEELPPLAGIPLALKDVLVQKGIPTTCGSKSWKAGGHPMTRPWSRILKRMA